MKKTFAWVCLAVLLQAAAVKTDTILQKSNCLVSQKAIKHEHDLSLTDTWKIFSSQKPALSIARQVPAAEAPVENRGRFSWWWWMLGVVIVIGLGMWVYTLIKKDPKKDAT